MRVSVVVQHPSVALGFAIEKVREVSVADFALEIVGLELVKVDEFLPDE